MVKVRIIGEIGINWLGQKDLAYDYINFCKDIGVDIAKFQLYDAERLLGKDSPYLTDAARGALTRELAKEFKDYCDFKEIEFGCSVFFP